MQSECAFNLSQVFGKEAVLEKKREGEGSEKRRRGKEEGEKRNTSNSSRLLRTYYVLGTVLTTLLVFTDLIIKRIRLEI